jgi:hypothetical protein
MADAGSTRLWERKPNQLEPAHGSHDAGEYEVILPLEVDRHSKVASDLPIGADGHEEREIADERRSGEDEKGPPSRDSRRNNLLMRDTAGTPGRILHRPLQLLDHLGHQYPAPYSTVTQSHGSCRPNGIVLKRAPNPYMRARKEESLREARAG